MLARASSCLVALLMGCPGAGTTPGDGSPEAGDVSPDDGASDGPRTDVEAGGDAGSDAGTASGPLTHVADEHEFVTDRLCDLDGDGLLDNSMADLGPTQGQIAAASLTSFLGSPDDAILRWLFHFPWVDDLAGLDAVEPTLIFAHGVDADVPPDPTDDFTGSESFLVRNTALDACGEPLSAFPSTVLDGGRVETRVTDDLVLDLGAGIYLAASTGSIFGTIESTDGRAEWLLCGALCLDELGPVTVGHLGSGDLSMLELLIGGGVAIGVPGVPGLSPDVDLDGDGLERITLDAESRIVGCVDGDLSSIPGRDCWRDERMADAISINLRFGTVPARLDGRTGLGEGTCDDPPETSLWDPP